MNMTVLGAELVALLELREAPVNYGRKIDRDKHPVHRKDSHYRKLAKIDSIF